jgi:hypothetical protein
LIRFERKGHGPARRFVEGCEEGSGGVPHAPCRIRVPRGRRLAGALRSGFAQLLGEQDRSGKTQAEMSSVHGACLYF